LGDRYAITGEEKTHWGKNSFRLRGGTKGKKRKHHHLLQKKSEQNSDLEFLEKKGEGKREGERYRIKRQRPKESTREEQPKQLQGGRELTTRRKMCLKEKKK